MIGIVNPRSGNITSVCDALERLKRKYRVLDEPDLSGIDQLLLPGQGRFGTIMSYFDRTGWTTALQEWASTNKPLLGICAGMQVLFEASDEDPGIKGLGVFKGTVHRLKAPKHPMIGWSNVHWTRPSFQPGAAYFVNSYGIDEHDESIGTTTYGSTYCVAVARGPMCAFQFHPEKSGSWGKELLNQCLL